MPRFAPWLALGAATAAASLALDRLGLPATSLFAALLLGLAVALRWPRRLEVGDAPFAVAQAVLGVTLGCYLRSESLTALAGAWLPVVLVTAATLLLCLLAGHVMARVTSVDEPTAALGMVAGGATGLVTMARDLGADDRLVAFMQYVRVLVVVLSTPLLVALAFPGEHGGGFAAGGGGPFPGTPVDWAATAAIALAGAVAGRLVRLPAGLLLGPLLLAAGLTLALPSGSFAVPPVLRELAFAVIGLQVGLHFTAGTVRQAGRLLLPVVVSVVALAAACFGLAAALHATTHASLLDAYLATTPGGISAVLATAAGTGADATFVVAVQSMRLLAMVLLAPWAVRLLLRARRRPGAAVP